MSDRFSAWLLPALLVAGALFLYLHRLSVPSQYIYDERYHAFTAAERLEGNADSYRWDRTPARPEVGYTWNHPPVGVHLIAAGISLWGDRSFGWRFASAVFGAAGILLVWALGRGLSGDRGVGELAAALVLLDGLYYVQARTAMLDTFGTVFMLAALLAFHRFLIGRPADAGRLLAITSLFLGLAIGTKWNAMYPAAAMGLVAAGRWMAAWRTARAERVSLRAAGLVELGCGILALIGVPLVVYLVAYLPFFAAGYGIGDWLELQRQMLAYHTGLRAEHAYASRWWEWPLALRPVWYHVNYGQTAVANIYANVNPLLAWAFVPAVLWVAGRWWSERRAAFIVLVLGFFGQWLPWVLVPRIAFAYHFLPAVPFGALALATILSEWWRARGLRPWLAAGYVAAVALAFAFFHPIYAAVPLSTEAFERRIWLDSWR